MSQTLSLYRLQQIDSQIDRTQVRLQAIQKILEDDAELRLASEQAQSSEADYMSAERVLKQAEADVQNQHIKIEQTESSLYSGTTHSPKELQDLQNDVAALKRHRVTLEDCQLEAMLASEKAEITFRSAQENLQVVRNRLVDQNRSLHQELETLQKEIGRLSTERNATVGAIPPDAIELYDQLRQQKRGLAIATISDNSCDACGSTLSLAQMQSARSSGQMALCPSCGRILYGS
jgi:predicted  nucleic acid-binding Zn-ribbon protein